MVLSDGKAFSVNPFAAYAIDRGRVSMRLFKASESDLETVEIAPHGAHAITVEEWVAIVEAEGGRTNLADPSAFESRLRSLAVDADTLCKMVGQAAPAHLTWKSFDDLVDQLTRSGILARDENELRLTTTRCQALVTKDGIFAFENRDGRFNALFPDEYLKYLRVDPTYDYRESGMFALFKMPV